MQGISTLTQKGQISIPKSIRDYFNLKPFDKVHFAIEDNKIIAEPIFETHAMRGFIKAKKVISKAEMKRVIREAVVRKYANRT